MSDLRKLVSITLISLLVSIALLGSGWITQEVSAMDLNSAVDLEAAPHFRDLTYTVGTPSYSTSFDALGEWKVSIGNPRLAIVQSNLVITAPSSSMVRMTLTAGDAPGINETGRSTIQIKVIPSNVTTAYTNVTLAASSDASDHVAVSFHGGEALAPTPATVALPRPSCSRRSRTARRTSSPSSSPSPARPYACTTAPVTCWRTSCWTSRTSTPGRCTRCTSALAVLRQRA